MSQLNDLFQINFRVRASLSTGKKTVVLSNLSENSTVHPYDFFCGIWMGGENPHMDFKLLKGQQDGTGEAEMKLLVNRSDTDTFKIGIYVRDPETAMIRHVVSGFKSLQWLEESLNNVTEYEQVKQSMSLKDNYSGNSAILHFRNVDTSISDMKVFSKQLKISELHNNESINRIVADMTVGVHNWIEKSSNVMNMNGGPNFVNSTAYVEGMGCAINYPLLNITYSSDRHKAPLSMLSYMALATLHYVNETPENLLKMNDSQFMSRFVIPMCTSFTVCPKTMIYSGDKTIDPRGNLTLATEDFAMVLSKHFYSEMNEKYVDNYKNTLSKMSLEELSDHITFLKSNILSSSKGSVLIADDCETLSGLIKSIDGGIHKYYLNAVSSLSTDPETDSDTNLGKMMWESTRDMKNLSSVPIGDFIKCGKLLVRYGRLRENCSQGKSPCAQIGMAIVSAKGPSFSLGTCELNGHACTVAQTLGENGESSYAIGEGTSNMTMRDIPPGYPESVYLMLSTGEKMKFKMHEAIGVVSQSLSEELKTTGLTRIGQVIPESYNSKNVYNCCPFYMAGFFLGLELSTTTPGVIPLEVHNQGRTVLASHERNRAQERTITMSCVNECPPTFGAPVATLASDSVRAFPLNLGKVMGEADAEKFLRSVKKRNDEMYPPRADEETLKMLMSRWGDIEPVWRIENVVKEKIWISSSAEGFNDADMVKAMYEYKSRLSNKFNELQKAHENEDGVRMVVKQHMLSVVSHFHIPLPMNEEWTLTCAHNIRVAAKELNIEGFKGSNKSELIQLNGK